MPGLTVSQKGSPLFNVHAHQIAFDSSYPLGGEALTSANLGWHDTPLVWVPAEGDYLFECNIESSLLIARWNKLGVSTSSLITFTHDTSAASNGVAVYIHRDEVSEQGTALGHFECVNAGNADSYFKTAAGGAKVMIQDDDNAASGGFAVFVNEDDTGGLKLTADLDLITGTDTSASILVPLEDGTCIRVFDQDNPGGETGTVQLYFDDDAATDTARLLYVSPTTTSSTDRLWTHGGEVPNGTDLSALTSVVAYSIGNNPS